MMSILSMTMFVNHIKKNLRGSRFDFPCFILKRDDLTESFPALLLQQMINLIAGIKPAFCPDKQRTPYLNGGICPFF